MEIKDVVLFAFNSDPVVFAHVLLNALDMKGRGGKVKVVIEGDATKQVSLLRNETKPFASVWQEAKKAGVIDGVCRACAQKNTVVPAVVEQGLRLLDDMSGHPSVARYIAEGFTVLVF